jgi:hypothetical protein
LLTLGKAGEAGCEPVNGRLAGMEPRSEEAAPADRIDEGAAGAGGWGAAWAALGAGLADLGAGAGSSHQPGPSQAEDELA